MPDDVIFFVFLLIVLPFLLGVPIVLAWLGIDFLVELMKGHRR